MTSMQADSFWESAEAVERFTDREPDVRLLELLETYAEPGRVRVLDIGCAAGRNTVALVQRGFDVVAVDSSAAMVTRTRERVAPFLGGREAELRVQLGSMEDLGFLEDGSIELALALGVLHQATTQAQWSGAIEEIGRCLAPDGRLLVASWSPRSRPHGEAISRVEGEENAYAGFHSGTHYLVEADELDGALESVGLLPVVPTEEVRVDTEKGWRITINGSYRKMAPPVDRRS
ncbi:MAG: class I SAM-dependent methyltransferase [marine benthic group bacterium]|nr:class I SAM-dependent methyltransferase [Candidatus Benthicola marisminoris]